MSAGTLVVLVGVALSRRRVPVRAHSALRTPIAPLGGYRRFAHRGCFAFERARRGSGGDL
jgi:hypothetical protein